MLSAKKKLFNSFLDGPLIWMVPMIIILLGFFLYPIFQIFVFSFSEAKLFSREISFSFDSYTYLLSDPTFGYVMRITLIYVLSTIVLELTCGLSIALLFHNGERLGVKGTAFARTIVLSAWVIPGIIIGVLWRMLLSSSSYGVINYLTQIIGLGEFPFLYSPNFALVAVILTGVWRGTAFSMIMEYAGLKRIPEELYEAATVDGAAGWQQFFYITIPQLKPIILINIILITIYTFNSFDMIMSLTHGGPGQSTEVIALNIYQTIFKNLDLGTGSAIAVVLFLINLFMALIYAQVFSSEEA